MKRFLVVIPTYNESLEIEKLLLKIISFNLKHLEILIVDDNSPDGTGKIVKKLIKQYPKKIAILERKKKTGLGRAYIDGFRWALKKKYDFLISMDADFSHDPKYLSVLIRESDSYDIVIGSRYIKGGKIAGWKWFRHANSMLANFFTRVILGLKPKDVTAGYKRYSIDFIKSLDLNNIISSGYAFQVEMIYHAQKQLRRIKEIPIVFIDRREGKSKISGEFVKSVKAIFAIADRDNSTYQMIKFGIVGLLGFIIDLGLFNLLTVYVFLNIYFARTISFSFAVLNNYIFNKMWTSRDNNKAVARQFAKFALVSILGLFLNLIVMFLIGKIVSSADGVFLKRNIPVICAMIVVYFWNYYVNKNITFKA